MFDLKFVIGRLADGGVLQRSEATDLFNFLVSGEATQAQIGALLMALRLRGETVDEIVGAVDAMRPRMVQVRAPEAAMDVVGTGGDASGSFNISTCAAFIVAGAGVPVAKHGNGKLSSRCGSADVLKTLGVRIDIGVETIERCIVEAGIGFMFAPSHHPALKQVMPARTELAMRTIFNILGPLLNPAGVRRHLIGVYARRWVEPIAYALRELGSERMMVVHGSDGLDEVTTTGSTFCAVLKEGQVETLVITPEIIGLPRVTPQDLVGGSPEANAVALRGVLEGNGGAYRDVAVFNAAAALFACGEAGSWDEAARAATRSLDEGLALGALDRLVRVSNAGPEAAEAAQSRRSPA